MSKYAKFTLLTLAAFVFMGLYATSVCAAGPAPKIVVPVEKTFYLTKDGYLPPAAPTACAAGFHFANVFELSGLTYNTDLGVTSADSGYGPPSHLSGWARSGLYSSTTYNCGNWSTDTNESEGTVAIFNLIDLTDGKYPIQTATDWCSWELHVWCVSDGIY